MHILKKLLKGIAVAGLVTSLSPALAADWPERAITFVVPLSPGGSTDTTARLLAEQLGKELGQTIVIENRPGAGGNIGAASVAKSKPDGYTFLFHTSTLTTNVSLYKEMPLDVKKDLIPVVGVARIPNVLMVNADFPAKNLQEFIGYTKQKKGPMNYGSAGNGTSQHLSGALLNHMIEGEMVHVPYKGGAPANAGLMGGQVQAVFSPLVEVLSHIEAGKLRPLGVTTASRSDRLPDVPAIAESLPGFSVELWNGVFAPAGTPDEIVTKMNTAVNKILDNPDFKKTLESQGSRPLGMKPQEFRTFVDSEITKWGELVKISGATPM